MPENGSRLSRQLLECARKRIAEPKQCTEADLRRATSDLYYCLFHAVCEALVEPIGHDADNSAFKETYKSLYRLPDHQTLEKKCKEAIQQAFSPTVRRFAQRIIAMKNKRSFADYDPLEQFSISDVRNDLALAEDALLGYEGLTPTERSRFAIFVSLEGRRAK